VKTTKLKKTDRIAKLTRERDEALAGQVHTYHFASYALNKLSTDHLAGSGLILSITVLGGDVVAEVPNFTGEKYRIKPPAKKYRVALFRRHNDEPLVVASNSQVTADNYESMPDFVRWLTDWIEYEE